MQVILKDDYKGLGYKNDVVTVKPGFGRNYLIPQGIAIEATVSNLKVLKENLRQAAHKAEKIRNEAVALSEKLEGIVLTIKAKAGESGKIFGSVTNTQVAEVLREKGFDIDRKKVSLPADVKMLGDYEVSIDLHKEVKKVMKISVVAD